MAVVMAGDCAFRAELASLIEGHGPVSIGSTAEYRARNREVLDLYAGGLTYAEAARHVGLSTERVRQIVALGHRRLRFLEARLVREASAPVMLRRYEVEPGWLVFTPETWDAA